jgi:hypothetical protein
MHQEARLTEDSLGTGEPIFMGMTETAPAFSVVVTTDTVIEVASGYSPTC